MIINKRKNKILNHPILSLFLLAILGEVMLQYYGLFIGIFIGLFHLTNSIWIDYISSFVSIFFSLIFLWIYILWFQNDFKGVISKENLLAGCMYCAIPILIFVLLNLFSFESVGNPLYAFIVGIAPGISEEIIFRAIPLSNAMRNFKSKEIVYIYIWISGVIFGAVHLLNMIMGAGIAVTLTQVIYATGLGILFGAIFVRTGNIIPCMIAHSIIDISALLDQNVQLSSGILPDVGLSIGTFIGAFILFAIPAIFGAFTIFSVSFEDIKQLWANKWSQQ